MAGLVAFVKGLFSNNVSMTIFLIEVIMFSLDIVFYKIVYKCLKDIDRDIDKRSFNGVQDLIKGYNDMVKKSKHINTQSYIEAYFSNYKYLSNNKIFNRLDMPIINIISIINMTISIFILMGVLGTFTGLTISLNSLRTGKFTVDNIGPILSGMGVAFYASIVGIAFSLILTFITKVFDAEQLLMNIMAKLEDYMDNELNSYNSQEIFQKIEAAIEKLSTSNNESINKFSKASNETMNKSLDAVERIYEFVEKFSTFPQEFQKSTKYMTSFNKKLKESVEGFGLIFDGFNELMQTFDKGINALDGKFDILDSYVKDINASQEKVEKSYVDIYDKLNKLTDNFYSSLENLNYAQKDFLKQIKSSYDTMSLKYANQINRVGTYIDDMSKSFKSFEGYLENIQKQQKEVMDSYNRIKEYIDGFITYIVQYNQSQNEISLQTYKDMKNYFSNYETILNNIIGKIEHLDKGSKEAASTYEHMNIGE